MPTTVPPSVLSPLPDAHVLIKKKLDYSSVATTYVISVLAASIAEVGEKWEQTNIPNVPKNDPDDGGGYLKREAIKYACVVVSAELAETVTYPLDLTKTRLQIQGEKAAANGNKNGQYRGMLNTAVGIAREEGFFRLWKGITPALYRHVIYSGVRIVSYENIRDKLLQGDPERKFPLWKSALTGATSGGVAQFLASPADLVKVQIQMEGKRRLLGLEPRVHSTWHAFTKILKEGGIRGLWKGSIPNVQRAALVNLGDLTTYDTAKRLILRNTTLTDNYLTHVLSSACAGLVAATMGTPADVVKTRIMNQPTDENGRGLLYKSSIDCLRKTVQGEGLFALYKGFLPIWIRMAPWSLTFWLSFEQIRHTMGVTAF